LRGEALNLFLPLWVYAAAGCVGLVVTLLLGVLLLSRGGRPVHRAG
jgi:type VI protein secretion system component VasF